MTDSLFVGIDVSLKNNQVCVMNFDQHVFFNLSFPNNPDGCNSFINKILDIYSSFNFSNVIFVTESTGVYNFHVACFLASNETLNNLNSRVFCVNPKDILNYKESFNNIEKTDKKDSFIIADFARVGRTKNFIPFKGSQFIALQRLTRQRFHIVKQLVKEKNYVFNNIYLSFSGLIVASKKDKPFYNLFSNTCSSLLEEFLSPEQIASTSIEDLQKFIIDKGKNHSLNIDKKSELLKKASKSSFQLDKTSYEPINFAIASSLNLIRYYEKQIKEIDKVILKTISGLHSNEFNSLLSIRGIGKVYAAGIIAEIGSISFFKNQSKLAKYAGLYWNKNQSGNIQKNTKGFSEYSNKYLRYYIVEATSSCINTNFPFIKDYYNRKYDEVTSHQHKRALVLSSRKLIRLIFTLLQKNQYYVPVVEHSKN